MIGSRVWGAPAMWCLVTLSIVGAVDAQRVPEHLLRYTFTEGAETRYVVRNFMDMSMHISGKKMTTRMDMEMFMTSRVQGLEDDGAVVSHRTERVLLNADLPMIGDVRLDTDDEDSVPSMFDFCLDLIEGEVVNRMSDRGASETMHVPEAWESLGMGQGVEVDSVVGQFAQFPDEPVAVGGTWTTSWSRPVREGVTMEARVTNTLVSVEGPTATIDMDIDLEMVDAAGAARESSVHESRGRIVFDLRNALMQSVDMTMKMVMGPEDEPSSVMTMTMELRPLPAEQEAPQEEGGK